MNKKAKTVPKAVAERNLFDELTDGIAALAEARRGNRILPTHSVEFQTAARITANEPRSP